VIESGGQRTAGVTMRDDKEVDMNSPSIGAAPVGEQAAAVRGSGGGELATAATTGAARESRGGSVGEVGGAPGIGRGSDRGARGVIAGCGAVSAGAARPIGLRGGDGGGLAD
jgi:hypothetical protein